MTNSSTRENYTNIVHEIEVDGGWSGQLRLVAGKGQSDEVLVFVDSELLGPRRLVLTLEEAKEVGHQLGSIAHRADYLLRQPGR